MEKDDAKGLSIGMRDKRSNLLVLGGKRSNLWRLSNGLYAVDNEVTASPEASIEAYNKVNETKLELDYIEQWYKPWDKKQVKYVLVPSRTNPSKSYKVKTEPGGYISCECQGFMYRGSCWHVNAVRELSKEKR